ncbi:hypothetical protein PL263_11515 [Methylomonas sp. EFPC3]|uniref:Flagellar biosynthesis protein FlgE n=1 Tax=Methylomonas aurea TaxID=2952224 RepID=A0ABT1UMX8_9GAMM|nr:MULTISPECIES: hypothetical protein [Methylomonas]MCQ8183592.1 hypothetical protein [Methylomonas sp. SURF-1]TPQ29273.1 hypothetical protein C2U68_02145 [Methylomonas koyamae]WFP48737.1 hypothetical protein PL263_11515 [Methylomonas sp. EFPC3]
MITNALNSATSLISQAQQKASTAAQTIASLPVQEQEVGGSKDVGSAEMFKPVLSLKEAELETSAGVKIIKAHEKMLGSILDIRA